MVTSMREIFNYIIVGIVVAFLIYILSPKLFTNKIEIIESVQEKQEIELDQRSSYSNTFNKVKNSVVTIYTSGTTKRVIVINPRTGFPEYRDVRPGGQGSGVVVTNTGHIVTNYHVLRGADRFSVRDYEGNDYDTALVGVDPESDLAVLKINGKLKPIVLGNMNKVNVGDISLAIGNPLGVGQTLTLGIISATGRDKIGINTFENFIQTDAAINSGNSGGALVNVNGELIGINTAIISESRGSDGIGFAIPIDMVKNILYQIIEHGSVSRGFIGASAVPSYRGAGVLVNAIYEKGPADIAGLQVGDIIKSINGVEVNNIRTVQKMITQLKVGEILILDIIRKDVVKQIEIKISKRPIPN
tara:strand:- start:404 stop:1480 length:1077 start_codon:yes stop_codon:yes gene_type:complete